jgi:hypothetical protein
MRTLPAPLLVALLTLGVLVSINVVPSVFLVDDNNYLMNVLALRQGRVTVANTEGLSPSRELLFFDPSSRSRAVTSTPIASTAPPLYAVFALPFSTMGWRGLVALNTLAYLVTVILVFQYSQRYATEASTPWVAAGAFALGGYAIEYALGLWPQALSFALSTAAIVAAGRVLDTGKPSLAAAAGFLLAAAAGVRYQNAVVLAAVGGAIVLLAPLRWRALAAFLAAAAVPLSTSAVINHFRFASWNPISKGPGYLSIPVPHEARRAVLDPFVLLWARVVDYSAHPPLTGRDPEAWLRYDAASGAHLLLGVTLKKALLQSAPWAILALVLFVATWAPGFRMPAAQRRQLRLLSMVAFAILGTFALSGITRHDGMSFNERYLLEVLPLAAVAFAWAVEQPRMRPLPFCIGAAIGGSVVLVILLGTPMYGGPEVRLWLLRQIALLKIPLVLAAALTISWLLQRAGYGRRALVTGAVGASFGWGLTLHLASDVLSSQFVRTGNLARTEALADVLTNGSALVAYWGNKDAAGPLLLSRDIVVLDAQADDGKDAPVLIRELLAKNRKVFVLENGFPAEVLDRVLSGLHGVPVEHRDLRLFELR